MSREHAVRQVCLCDRMHARMGMAGRPCSADLIREAFMLQIMKPIQLHRLVWCASDYGRALGAIFGNHCRCHYSGYQQ